MNKEFVTYEIASELKELGFNEPCFGYYYTLNGKDWKFIEKTEYHRLDDEMNIGSKFTLLVPLYQQVFRWFEEKYSYFVDVKTDTTPNEILGFDYYIKSWKFPPMVFDFFKDKREGNIAVIKKMIEMVKKEKQKEILIDLMNLDNDDKDLDK
jgi:hypothetical protein